MRTLEVESPGVMAPVPGVDHLYLVQFTTKSDDRVAHATISLLETNGLSVITATTVEKFQPSGLALDPSGMRLYVVGVAGDEESSAAGRCLVLETGGHQIVASFPAGRLPTAIAVHPTGTRAYVVDYDSARLMVIATSSNTILDTVPLSEGPLAVALNAAGTEVYVSHIDGTLTIVSAATNTVIGENRP